MGVVESVRQSLRNYFEFNGRATRFEFWLFLLFVAVAQAVANLFGYAVAGVVGLLLLAPQLSVAVRRLHDVNKSGRELVVPAILMVAALLGGALMAIVRVGFAGILLLAVVRLIMLWAKEGSRIPNKYGAAPTAFSFAKG